MGYTGDTTLAGIEQVPDFQRCRVLILECTFLKGKIDPGQAHERGHMHIDDLIGRPDLFPNPHLVLTHFSERHAREDIPRLIDDATPDELHSRIHIL